jgi:glycosyltransferase involved in cell wall biosynthesis
VNGDRSAENASLSYVLVTPARNEGAYLEATIRAVISQTVHPRKWIIVSDGSTDETDQIIERYAARENWIEFFRMPERQDRQFAAKARAFNAGCARLGPIAYDIIGNLDADITFERDYFQFLLSRFASDPDLGVAGTPFVEDRETPNRHTYAHQFAQLEHVSGACQMFRRSCFEMIGGYRPLKGGAIDWIAVTTARMKGWKTRTFTEKVCFHHRKLGVGSGSPGMLRTNFHYGRKAYLVGGHPLWEISRGLFRMRQRPLLLGGLWFICGYLMTSLRRSQRCVPEELMQFHRAEQMRRLRNAASRIFSRNEARSVAAPSGSNS